MLRLARGRGGLQLRGFAQGGVVRRRCAEAMREGAAIRIGGAQQCTGPTCARWRFGVSAATRRSASGSRQLPDGRKEALPWLPRVRLGTHASDARGASRRYSTRTLSSAASSATTIAPWTATSTRSCVMGGRGRRVKGYAGLRAAHRGHAQSTRVCASGGVQETNLEGEVSAPDSDRHFTRRLSPLLLALAP